MHNVTSQIDGDILTITVNVGKTALDTAPRSTSGKTNMVATTSGFTSLGPVSISLNVTTKAH